MTWILRTRIGERYQTPVQLLCQIGRRYPLTSQCKQQLSCYWGAVSLSTYSSSPLLPCSHFLETNIGPLLLSVMVLWVEELSSVARFVDLTMFASTHSVLDVARYPWPPHRHPGHHTDTLATTQTPWPPHRHPGHHTDTLATTRTHWPPHGHPGHHTDTMATHTDTLATTRTPWPLHGHPGHQTDTLATTRTPWPPHGHPGHHTNTLATTRTPWPPHGHPGHHTDTLATTRTPWPPHRHPGHHTDTLAVSSLNSSRPQRNLSNYSHAHTLAEHSFSICAYRCPAGIDILDRTPLDSYFPHRDLAWAHLQYRRNWHRHLHRLTLSRCSTPVSVLRLPTSSSWQAGPHAQTVSSFRRSFRGRVTLCRSGRYEPRTWTIPMTWQRSFLDQQRFRLR